MKALIKTAPLAVAMTLLLATCSDNATGPNDLGGDPNIEVAKVGGNFGVSLQIGEKYYDKIKDSVVITGNNTGIVTVRVYVDISAYPELSALVPAEYKDAEGNVNTEVKLRATSAGIQTFYRDDPALAKPFTLAKYDDNVGAAYSFTRSDGSTVTRTVTEKTGKDEFPIGFLLIKTLLVEQSNSTFPGVSKIFFRVNHKFGLVWVQFLLSDGATKATLRIYPPNL